MKTVWVGTRKNSENHREKKWYEINILILGTYWQFYDALKK